MSQKSAVLVTPVLPEDTGAVRSFMERVIVASLNATLEVQATTIANVNQNVDIWLERLESCIHLATSTTAARSSVGIVLLHPQPAAPAVGLKGGQTQAISGGPVSTKTELPRIVAEDPLTNPIDGVVKWSPINSIWLTLHAIVALVGGALTISAGAIAVFVVTTAVTLCLGHSLGMHRKLIHNSFACPKWLEYFFVHCGVLVGMAGPFGMVRTHDLRDWAQRQPDCHPYLRHGSRPLRDAWWQLHCELHLTHPPRFVPDATLAGDRMYRFMQRTWMLQQVPLALLLFTLGGLPWVIWGISARVTVSVIGHWLIGYLAHNSGPMDNEVVGAAVQGHNVKWASYLTMGESWHNNHHAYPGSAVLGLYDDQPDPGWWVLNALSNIGWVWNIVLPEHLPVRKNLHALTARAQACTGTKSPKPCPVLNLLR